MGWAEYLRTFHDERPGVTDAVLGRSRGGGEQGDPYSWLLEAVPPAAGRVLDLACGSAPLFRRLIERPHPRLYVGVDASAGELRAARQAGAQPLVRASANAIPLPAGSVDVVVCSMALMVLTSPDRALAEISRVLAPDGLLVATVPARGPIRPVDLPVVTALMAALGRRLTYPGDQALRRLDDALARAGLRLESDVQRRFGYRLRARRDADLFLSSLYLPGLPPSRRRLGRAYLRTLARMRAELPVPIRRVTARRRH